MLGFQDRAHTETVAPRTDQTSVRRRRGVLVYDAGMDRLAVVLLACSGCDGLFGLTRDGYPDASTGDALDGSPIDAIIERPCAGRSPTPVFCFDFDGQTQVGYEDGLSFPLQVMTMGAIVDRRAPSATGERALWLEAVTQGYAFIVRDAPAKSFHRLSARFSMRGFFTAVPTAELSLFQLALSDAGPCTFSLLLEPTTLDLMAQIECGAALGRGPIGKLTDAWHRYELALDARTGVGSTSVDGAPPTTLGIQGIPDHAQPPAIVFGLIGSEAGVTVAFDDVDVTGQ
jgi:hypothetical protein